MKAAYNSVGQMVSEKWFDKDDNKTAHYKYVYDGQGNIVRSIDIGAERQWTVLCLRKTVDGSMSSKDSGRFYVFGKSMT